MIIDHIGYYLFPQILIFRVIGRVAMPIFCILFLDGIELNLSKGITKIHRQNYLIISVIIYIIIGLLLGFNSYYLFFSNIIITFLLMGNLYIIGGKNTTLIYSLITLLLPYGLDSALYFSAIAYYHKQRNYLFMYILCFFVTYYSFPNLNYYLILVAILYYFSVKLWQYNPLSLTITLPRIQPFLRLLSKQSLHIYYIHILLLLGIKSYL